MDAYHIALIVKAYDLLMAKFNAVMKPDFDAESYRALENEYHTAADILVLKMHQLVTELKGDDSDAQTD